MGLGDRGIGEAPGRAWVDRGPLGRHHDGSSLHVDAVPRPVLYSAVATKPQLWDGNFSPSPLPLPLSSRMTTSRAGRTISKEMKVTCPSSVARGD